MGYSVAVAVKSKKAKDEMLAFLAKNFRPWSTIAIEGGLAGYEPGVEYISGPTDDLSYDHGKLRIGFDFSGGGGWREYAFQLCYWVALKVGRERILRKLGRVSPYIVYDGYEAWPVVVGPPPLGMEWAEVSTVGFKEPSNWKEMRLKLEQYNQLSDEQLDKPQDKATLYSSMREYVDFWSKEVGENQKMCSIMEAELYRLDTLWNVQNDSK